MPQLIKDIAATRTYLITHLHNLTEADPQILSDYILALLRHNKPLDEMIRLCHENLSDFLHEKTHVFVAQLFSWLQHGDIQPNSSNGFDKSSSVVASAEVDAGGQGENDHMEDINVYKEVRQRDYIQSSSQHNQHQPYFIDNMPSSTVASSGSRYFSSSSSSGRRPYNPGSSRRYPSQRTSTASTRLLIDRIPLEKCNVTAITQFFSRFGTLLNLSVDVDAKQARLQYGSEEEARAAYNCPNAIFDNRFVRCFWDDQPTQAASAPNNQQQTISAKEKEPQPVNSAIPRPSYYHQVNLGHMSMQSATSRKQDALKNLLTLQRQQQDLLTKYLEQQQALASQLESSLSSNDTSAINGQSSVDGPKVDDLEASIKGMDSLIQSMRQSIQSVELRLSALHNTPTSSNNNNSISGSAVENTDASPDRTSTAAFSNVGGEPVLRGGPVANRMAAVAAKSQSLKLDLRPKAFAILGATPYNGNLDGLKSFLEEQGCVKSFEGDAEVAVVQYSERYEAEKVNILKKLS